jgi:hypothetical protein
MPSSSSSVIRLAASGDSASASPSSLPATDDAPTMATRVVAVDGRRFLYARSVEIENLMFSISLELTIEKCASKRVGIFARQT